ncbi:hypothetical protein EVAR_4417_1 [Eumeta japonica]|uniref:Uncharacterized protein n=1 Tax=Eumeta variegata TaxID=151549 RepID=A0A4C1SYH8_EUMVA|nr:hypothetical protein EVAR_4417_1 [Eumeta japonica]
MYEFNCFRLVSNSNSSNGRRSIQLTWVTEEKRTPAFSTTTCTSEAFIRRHFRVARPASAAPARYLRRVTRICPSPRSGPH